MIGVTPAGPAVLVALRCDPVAGCAPGATFKVGANPCATVDVSVAESLIAVWPPHLCAMWGFDRLPDGDQPERYAMDLPTVSLRSAAADRGWIWPLGMGYDDWLLSLVVRLHLERDGVTP